MYNDIFSNYFITAVTGLNHIFNRKVPFLFALLFISGCGQQTRTPLQIGFNNWIGFQPFYIARDQGYYDDKVIKLVELNNSTDVMQELRTGRLHAAALTLDETLTMMEEGLELRVILVTDISAGGDALVARPEYSEVARLRGKKIAVEYTATGAVLLDAALISAGMTLDDIEIVSCQFDQHINCYGSADAVVTFEPVKTKLVKQGANVVYDSSSIIGRIIDVLIVRKDVLQSHHFAIQELVDGYFQAIRILKDDPERVYRVVKRRTGLSSEELDISYAGIIVPERARNRDLFSSGELQAKTQKLIDVMLDKELLSETVSIKTLFDARFLAEL